jgi:hypothetical protein
MITCGKCHRFVKVKAVFIESRRDDIVLVLAICTLHGEIAAEFTDYSELVNESAPPMGPWTGGPLPVPRGLSAL